MTEAEAFIGAIGESLYDDTPRLVYADWLDEHGEQADGGWRGIRKLSDRAC